MSSLATWSAIFLYSGFGLYSIATILFGLNIKDESKQEGKSLGGTVAISITILGLVAQISYFVTRWIAGGHAPLTNMFEFMTFLGMSISLAFIIIYFIYRLNVLGLFALPIVLIIMAYASMFPREISPLVPSLQSPWLPIHVSTVSLSQGILGVSFVAGLIYLIKSIDQSVRSKQALWLEAIMYTLFIFIGFIVVTMSFKAVDYEATFEHLTEDGQIVTSTYSMPAIAGPKKGELATEGVMDAWFATPEWFQGADADRKLNTLIWSIFIGSIIYLIVRLIVRKRIGAALQPSLKKVNLDLMDEITYRAIAIGFPLFTLGGLIFAAIWAQIAWDRFWGWDPKEVWALITWFFYAAFLHLRLSRGWHGERTAWLAVGGFAIIMFNLIVVNLVLAGLHSYA